MPTRHAVLNRPIDVSEQFQQFENDHFAAMAVEWFDAAARQGELTYQRLRRKPRLAFNQFALPFEETGGWEFPPEYDLSKFPFRIDFVSPRTLRLRISARPTIEDRPSLMLDGPVAEDDSWEVEETGAGVTYRGPHGSVAIQFDPWRLTVRDSRGRTLTQTYRFGDSMCLQNHHPIPFSFVRVAQDLSRMFAASFTLAPDEKLYGAGESFTRLNKRGQKFPLYPTDAHGALTDAMYKPVPMFLSSRGYGMFVHTSAPTTFDFGRDYDEANVIYVGEEVADLFLFLGEPKDVVEQYTAVTGRSPVPPLWSFGLWMSRITYRSEQETREVAAELRERRIPCDVIHLDTGWFETEWQCDYRFARSRFDDAGRMLAALKDQGFRISLWQLPYFTPTNPLWREAVDGGYVVRGGAGGPATDDAVVDFSSRTATQWYQGLLRQVLDLGVGAIKADFGEGAPVHGQYACGRTGWFEHNLYPLRYNKAVAEITEQVTGERIIWARSAWAGSQRYPVHWGGDAENTAGGMAASLRAGLSFGLSGFPFWSHDIGGFVRRSPRDLYRRWMPFGMLTSHSRCHGAPPREPWAYDEAFTDDFRRAVELKYRLMPYIYTQAKISSETGWPMMRALFFEFPEDPTAWFIEDEYMLGDALLVAPLIEQGDRRVVYLPPGLWFDYQTEQIYEGGVWHEIAADEIPCILLVRHGRALPRTAVAQHTGEIDWTNLQLSVYVRYAAHVRMPLCLPDDGELRYVKLNANGGNFTVSADPFDGRVNWTVRQVQ